MRIIIPLLGFMLASCQYVPPRDIGSPFFSPPAGSQLRLTRPLTIPANDAGVFIQDGKPQYSSWRLNRYYPHCDFELHTRASQERVIEPDTFTVIRTVRATENVLLAPAIVASFGGSGDGPPGENYMTTLYLHSDRQADVFRMTCQHWEDPSEGKHLTVQQIRQTLGDLFVLTIAGGEN